MVQINVSQLLKSPIGSIRGYELNEVMDTARNNSLVQGEAELIRTDRGILVKGRLHTKIELTCSRCFSLFGYPLTLGIEEEYFPTIDIITGRALPAPDEPGSFTIDECNILNLTEATSQYALLAIPMKPLCAKDCAGLCPVCGDNLNQAPCNCPPNPTNPRWSELRKLAFIGNQTSANKQKELS